MARTQKPKPVDNAPAPTGAKLGYARVSTDDQDLGMQIAALEKVPCDRLYQEKRSGAAKRRPQLDLLWKDLRPGDTLYVWRLDRLGRSFYDLAERMKWLKDNNIGFVSLTEAIDTRTAIGGLIGHLAMAFAEFERRLTIERTSAGLRRLKDQGVRLGAKPRIDAAQKDAIKRDLLNVKLSIKQVAKRHKIGTSTIHYLFPGGRAKLLGKRKH